MSTSLETDPPESLGSTLCSVCPNCGGTFDFKVPLGRVKPRPTKYCSKNCRYEAAKLNRVKSCRFCGARFAAEDKRGKREASQNYCSRSCAAKASFDPRKLNGVGAPSGLGHHAEKGWRLRSPRNVVYTFRNLSHFVQTHLELFHKDDLRLRPDGKTVAEHGLKMLSVRLKNPNAVWKGWVWASQTERVKNEGMDLLDRFVSSPNAEVSDRRHAALNSQKTPDGGSLH